MNDEIEIEQALLGALLNKNSFAIDVAKILKPEYFTIASHGNLFREIVKRSIEGKSSTALTIGDTWANDDELSEDVPPRQYLARLESFIISLKKDAVLSYAERVSDIYRRRRLVEIANETKNRAENHQEPFEKIASDAAITISSLAAQKNTVTQSVDVFSSMMDEATSPVTPTGMPRLDAALEGGLYGAKFYCFSARMKAGKTTMLTTITYNAARKGKKVLYIALEMGKKEILQKIAGRLNGCSAKDVAIRNITPEQVARTTEHFKKISMDFEDCQGITINELIVKIIDAGKNGYDGVIFDYIQLVGGKSPKIDGSEADFQQRVAQEVANAVKKTPNMWVLTAAQLNREGQLRGSDGVRMAADCLLRIETSVVSERLNAWLITDASRYTAANMIGSEEIPAYIMNQHGTAYEEI